MGAFPDIDIAALAAEQHGVVSRVQLVALGLSAKAIERRIAAGRLHRIHRGVYAVGHGRLSREGRLMAAALACGPGAVLSHATAASVWDIRPTNAASIDVTIPSARGRTGPAVVRLRRRRGLLPTDVTRHNGLPVTSVARTLLDLAGTVRPAALDRALEQAEKLALLDMTPIAELLERERGRPGAPALARATALYAPEPTRSDLEADLLALCGAHDLPRPSLNTWIEGYEVDAHWPGTLLVAELDSRRHHHTTAAFERDRRRDAWLAGEGYTVLRFTWRRVMAEPRGVAVDIRRALSARARPGALSARARSAAGTARRS